MKPSIPNTCRGYNPPTDLKTENWPKLDIHVFFIGQQWDAAWSSDQGMVFDNQLWYTVNQQLHIWCSKAIYYTSVQLTE